MPPNRLKKALIIKPLLSLAAFRESHGHHTFSLLVQSSSFFSSYTAENAFSFVSICITCSLFYFPLKICGRRITDARNGQFSLSVNRSSSEESLAPTDTETGLILTYTIREWKVIDSGLYS